MATATKAKDIEALCASKGMRMTEQRRVIARTLASSEDHPDVEELYRRCSAIDGLFDKSMAIYPIALDRTKQTAWSDLA